MSSNLLSQATSPYLRQHARNPVHWQQWGTEAFGEAKRRNCPIFLSIGYSTCHWCHVMAHESFERNEVASVLNEHCVSIKIDREERPDIDRVYMGFVQALHGQGGWPLSVWLTPDLQPIFGGTYFPAAAVKQIVTSVTKAWHQRPDDLRRDGADIIGKLTQANKLSSFDPEMTAPDRERADKHLKQIGAWAREQYDSVHGGFGGAPKFPQPTVLRSFLHPSVGCEDQLRTTLHALADGGMYDHWGGGFHRYSIATAW